MQLIAWKDCPQNYLLCEDRDVKHPLTQSLTHSLRSVQPGHPFGLTAQAAGEEMVSCADVL